MVRQGNCAGGALALADAPVLCESAGARDRWFVRASVSADGVCTAIGRDGSEILSVRARIVRPVALYNVVLGLWRVDPTVDSKVRARTRSGVLRAIGNVAESAG